MNAETTALIRSLRGAPLTVLMALLLNQDRALGTKTLTHLTGYSDKTVTAALASLQEVGLAQRHGRYEGWLPTNHVRQLILGEQLPEPAPLARLPQPPQLLAPPETQQLSPEAERTFEVLVETCGLAPAQARQLLDGADPLELELDALEWMAYIADYAGRSIKNPPAFVARKLADGARPPAGLPLRSLAEERRHAARRLMNESGDYTLTW